MESSNWNNHLDQISEVNNLISLVIWKAFFYPPISSENQAELAWVNIGTYHPISASKLVDVEREIKDQMVAVNLQRTNLLCESTVFLLISLPPCFISESDK